MPPETRIATMLLRALTLATELRHQVEALPEPAQLELSRQITTTFIYEMLLRMPLPVVGSECPVCKVLFSGAYRPNADGTMDLPTRGAMLCCPQCRSVLQVGMAVVLEPCLRITPAEVLEQLSPEATAQLAEMTARAEAHPHLVSPVPSAKM